jgi:Uncharacterized conserved protein
MYIRVKVTTNAAKNEVLDQGENAFVVKVTASPERGKANRKVLDLVAGHFQVAKSAITIVKGAYASKKVMHIELPQSK